MRHAAARAARSLASTSARDVFIFTSIHEATRRTPFGSLRVLHSLARVPPVDACIDYERARWALHRDGVPFASRALVSSARVVFVRTEEDADAASSGRGDRDAGQDRDEKASESKRELIKGEQNFNAPNALCSMRIVAGPVLGVAIALNAASPEVVLGGVAAAAVTDYLDGFLARRWKQQTILGSYLDPVADKVFVGSVGLALALEGRLPVWLVSLLIFRDVVHVIGGAWRRAGALGWRWNTLGEFLGFDDKPVNRPPPTGAAALAGFNFDVDEVEGLGSKRGALRPLFIGKVNTAMQMALLAFACAEPVYATHASELPLAEFFTSASNARTCLEYATAASAVVATAEYTRIFLSHPGFDVDGRLKTKPREK